MTGWLHVDTAGLTTEDELRAVVDRGRAAARALPPKEQVRRLR